MSRFGYEPIDLPIIEDSNLFLIKAGDQIINRLFTFERHGKEFALRPEFTAAAAYQYIANKNVGHAVRWQFNGPIFVDDPNDISENYQQLSVGAELIGMNGQVAEAEIIAMSVQGLMKQGLDNWQLVIGHTGLIRQILAHYKLDDRTQRFLLHHFLVLKHSVVETMRLFDNHYALPEAATLTPVDSMHFANISGQSLSIGGRSSEEINNRLILKRNRTLERNRVIEVLNLLERWRGISGTPDEVFPVLEAMIAQRDEASQILLREWQTAVDLLNAYDIPLSQIVVEPGLARSWEYYTGIVFELSSADVHLGGGGRYDELARLVGGEQDIPAVGFAYYVDHLVPLLTNIQSPDWRVVPIYFAEVSAYSASCWAHQLHERAIAIELILGEEPKTGSRCLIAQSDETILFSGTTYTLEQIDVLIADLK